MHHHWRVAMHATRNDLDEVATGKRCVGRRQRLLLKIVV